MNSVEIERSGVLADSEKAYFGGAYSFWERIKMSGVGSSKIVYLNGIAAFDAMNDGIENEMNFVSFEIMKNGLILRLNRTQKLACVGVKITEIEKIKLTAYRIVVPDPGLNRKITKIIHRGVLEITEYNGEVCSFSIFTQNFESLLKYFTKKEFSDKFEYSVSDAAPEKDFKFLLDLLERWP